MDEFDLVVAGAGIVGLAHALAAARRGLRVAVLERDARAHGASVRNFGFLTLTGQGGGDTRRRVLRSLEVWREACRDAGIPILQHGCVFVAQRPEAMAVLEEFGTGNMAEGCELLDAAALRKRLPMLSRPVGGLLSPHELRIEAREALPRLAALLASRHGVVFHWASPFLGWDGTVVRHARGALAGRALVIATGTHLHEAAPQVAERARLHQCTLQMCRLAAPPWHLPHVVMSDLSLLRYHGLAALASTTALRKRLEQDCAGALREGVHLIVAQSADGSLVVGDSHHYAEDALPFAPSHVEGLILQEVEAVFALERPVVVERWLGHYAAADVKPLVREAIGEHGRLVTVTNGLGMSTAFAIGEETIAELFG